MNEKSWQTMSKSELLNKKRSDLLHKIDEKNIKGEARKILIDFFSKDAMKGDLSGASQNVFAQYIRFLTVVQRHVGDLGIDE